MNPLLATLTSHSANEQLARHTDAASIVRDSDERWPEKWGACVSVYHSCVYWAVAVAVRYFLRMRK